MIKTLLLIRVSRQIHSDARLLRRHKRTSDGAVIGGKQIENTEKQR